ncbi:MAG: DUF1905 domain-containing protein [Patescibacteria group bacterium]
MKNEYRMKAGVWLYPGMAHSTSLGQAGAWYFITLPKKESAEIKERFKAMKRGWGSLPVTVTLGKTSWKTSIFPEKKSGSYLLPLKVEVRKKEGVKKGDTVSFSVIIRI